MKRILFLAADLCSGGAERQMTTVACGLKKKGYDVMVYCYDKADFYSPILKEANIPIVWELEPTKYLKRIINVRRFVKKGCFNAVISFLPTCNFLNDLAAVGNHHWTVITGERSARESTFTSRRGKLYGWFQKYSDFIVCNSENARKMWYNHLPQFVSKLKVIYNCVQLGAIQSDYVPKKEGRLHILVAATYQYLKNPLGLIEALGLMSEEERNSIVIDWYGRMDMSKGDTKAYDDTREAIRKNNLGDVFVLHPDTKEIADKMNQADAVMLLSHFEGLPNAICEGMTIGKPIIMTRVSDYDILVDESNGFLCDWDNPESIKAAILSMEKLSQEQLQMMGESSKNKAVELFSADVITQQWEAVINCL